MFAYCYNNPVSYVDYTGENAAVLARRWLEVGGAIAVAEPTFVGELIWAAGALVLVVVVAASDDTGTYVGSRIGTLHVIPKDDGAEAQPEVDEKGRPVVRPGQQPTEKDGYIAPKDGPKWNKEKKGWEDKYGNVWVPAPTKSPLDHSGGHWDVQSPKGGYTNVYPGGKIRGGRKPYPNIPIFNRGQI